MVCIQDCSEHRKVLLLAGLGLWMREELCVGEACWCVHNRGRRLLLKLMCVQSSADFRGSL